MPTVLRIGPFRFFFYSLEVNEPPHIHIESGDKTTKYRLAPVELARSHGFRPQELTCLRALVIEHRAAFEEAWNAHFGDQA